MTTVTTVQTVKEVKVTYAVTKDTKAFRAEDVKTISAKMVDVQMETWSTGYCLHLTWFSESVRPLVKHYESIMSDDIFSLTIISL